ncbi:MAG TPA: hypothetical protein VML95_12030, partial [Longimicrobiales bacterium]|nr:hypothetical protein [Longimicrobiales bacterium]
LWDALHRAKRAAIDAMAATIRAQRETERAAESVQAVARLIEEAERYVGIDLPPGEAEPADAA